VPTTSRARSASSPFVVVLAALCAWATVAVAVAGPAAAIADPRRPSAEVTAGPSCGPGVVRVAVTNGTQPHRLTLVLDGTATPASAELAGGAATELVSADVDWGQTVDVSVAVTDVDGTDEAPIEFGTYTRPSAEDCAAVTAPAYPYGGEPSPAPSTAPTWGGEGRDDVSPLAASASSASVAPGGVVTVRAAGFIPGEPVAVSLAGADGDLTRVNAATDGSVEAVVQIPRAAALGTASVELVGEMSAASAGLDLQVAARADRQPRLSSPGHRVPPSTALIGIAGLTGLLAVRRPRGSSTPATR
jgi:hypothetical protein